MLPSDASLHHPQKRADARDDFPETIHTTGKANPSHRRQGVGSMGKKRAGEGTRNGMRVGAGDKSKIGGGEKRRARA